ncbi:ATP-dependent zinc metalloprotease FtsH [Candidatus Peregrinibacteria bacterium]|nr:ATP-dependent zinc metalloprotease FtsH [Candidatus Peregrinibacteria bacterium]
MTTKNKIPKKPGSNSFAILLAIVFAVSAIFLIMNPNSAEKEKVSLNTFIEDVQDGEVAEIQIDSDNNRIDATKIDGSQIYTFKESSSTLDDLLEDVPENVTKDIQIEVIPQGNNTFWMNLLISVVPFLLLIGFFVFMMRQAQSSNNQAMSFGKSKAKLYDVQKKRTKFEDVAGAEEAKEELVEVVDFLKNPVKYSQIGAKIPKGVLLVGPPGTGKTLLARAVAGEANVPFFTISGSEFVEMFVGVGASRVRDLFKKAQKNAPCIVFIDEIDAVGRQRGTGLGGGHDEREQTLNQILTEMDGFEGDTGIIVMAATNRPDVLDPALLRPGRFDRRVMVDLPDIKDREAILNVHGRNKPLEKSTELNRIAQHTPGFSGADLENLMNEAAIIAAKENRKTINQDDLQEATEKVFMGPERKSMVMDEEEKKKTAYHEVGHAIVAHLRPNCDPVHKITIISRGKALGVTWTLPEKDFHLRTKSYYFDMICKALGGYASEIIFFGEMSTGAASDLENATKVANAMVTKYGMSALGPIQFGEQNHEVFLGRDYGHTKNYSEDTAKRIDEEIKKLIDDAFKVTFDLIEKNKDKVIEISEALIKQEKLSREEFNAFFEEKKATDKTKKSKNNSKKTKK